MSETRWISNPFWLTDWLINWLLGVDYIPFENVTIIYMGRQKCLNVRRLMPWILAARTLSCCTYCVTGRLVLMSSPGFLTFIYVVKRSLMKLLLPCIYNDRYVAVGTRTLNLPHFSNFSELCRKGPIIEKLRLPCAA